MKLAQVRILVMLTISFFEKNLKQKKVQQFIKETIVQLQALVDEE